MHLAPAKPAPLRQIPLDGLTDQLPRGTALLSSGGLYFGQQAGGDKGIGGVSGFHVVKPSVDNQSVKEAVVSKR